jgi:hypothetical protein
MDLVMTTSSSIARTLRRGYASREERNSNALELARERFKAYSFGQELEHAHRRLRVSLRLSDPRNRLRANLELLRDFVPRHSSVNSYKLPEPANELSATAASFARLRAYASYAHPRIR